jgi:hypothetical protein
MPIKVTRPGVLPEDTKNRPMTGECNRCKCLIECVAGDATAVARATPSVWPNPSPTVDSTANPPSTPV